MEKPERVERYGKKVWETVVMDGLRKRNCLCLNCSKCTPGHLGACPIAHQFYEICKEHGNALIVTRCESWGPRA